MILAVSRFRVANGREEDVRRAFVDRPRLVDREPGFLGMEVFTDPGDASIFYLVTRWTDAESFRRWHGSEAHRISHRGIPHGLKLDAEYTKLVTLDRIEGAGPPPGPEQLALDWSAVLGRHLSDSSSVHVIAGEPDGTVRYCNFAVTLRLGRKVEQLCGRSVLELVAQPGSAELQARLEGANREPERTLTLELVDADGGRHALECRVDVQPHGFLLIGESPMRERCGLDQEVLELNDDLVVMARENARRGREMARMKARLEETLEELETTYWHLRKIQEVLPICMRCDRVKTGGADWTDVARYLKENALFLTHGYCPECEKIVMKEMGLD